MAHGHEHSHAHGTRKGLPFALAIGLNALFVAVEIIYGIAAESMALVADAIHNLSDVLGLALAWVGTILATRQPTAQRTYGLRKSSVLAALGNACLLLIAVGGIAWEALGRFAHPAPVQTTTVMVVAAIGILINGVCALLFVRGSQGDVNIKGAFLHLAADAAVSAGVVAAGLVMLGTGWHWLDPLTSIVISVVVVASTWGLLRESLDLALDSVPKRIDLGQVRQYLLALPEVHDVHDLHVWAMSTTEVALTAHLVTTASVLPSGFLEEASAGLHERFHIEHSTLQVEAAGCAGKCVLTRTEAV